MAKSKAVKAVDISIVPENFYSTFIKHEPGNQVLMCLESLFHSTLSHCPGDPYTTAYNEGRRAVVLFILQQIVASQNKQKEPKGEE